MTSLAVLITCFNRRGKTIACLEGLLSNALPSDLRMMVFLVDDGSTDGTSEAVRSGFPNVQLIQGTGDLYWGGGMRLAFSEAMKGNFDYYLWLNDDTIIYADTVSRMLGVQNQVERSGENGAIVVGTTCDAANGEPTYGGQIRTDPNRKLKFHLVIPSDTPVPCDTINGNCVLISRAVVAKVGNLDDALVHSMGDIDYGLRAVKAGCKLWVMPGFVGFCSWNTGTDTYNDRALSLLPRLRKMLGPKGLPFTPWRVLTKLHAGPLWFVYWLWPYTRVVIDSLARRYRS